MKNILFAIDARKLDKKSLDFSCYLAQLGHSPLTGMVLQYVEAEEESGIKSSYGGVYVETIDIQESSETQYRERVCEESIAVFKSACEERDIKCNVIRDSNVPLASLIAESRYADLLILEPSLLSTSPLDSLSSLVKDVLAKAECPVVLSPYHCEDIHEVVFAYDCQPASVYAIKQFTYLFPELCDKKIIVTQVEEEGDFKAENKEKIYKYLTMHYTNIEFKDLAGEPGDQLFDDLLRKSNAFVVMGAYGRTRLSNFFRHSTAESLIEMNSFPMFITHP